MVKIKTQAQYDKIKSNFSGEIEIIGGSEYDRIKVNRSFDNAEQSICKQAYVDICDSATVEYIYGSATVKNICDSAKLLLVSGLASVLMITGNSSVTTTGFNIVRTYTDETKTSLKLSKNTTLIKLDRSIMQPTTFDGFKQIYPVQSTKTKTILYKAVHKDGDKYYSDYNNSFKYEIGKKYSETIKGSESCNPGLHISHKWWAIKFGSSWSNMALLECEVMIKNIVVSSDTNGKIRTSELKVIREVPRSEW